jgi:hypothetical protein
MQHVLLCTVLYVVFVAANGRPEDSTDSILEGCSVSRRGGSDSGKLRDEVPRTDAQVALVHCLEPTQSKM